MTKSLTLVSPLLNAPTQIPEPGQPSGSSANAGSLNGRPVQQDAAPTARAPTDRAVPQWNVASYRAAPPRTATLSTLQQHSLSQTIDHDLSDVESKIARLERGSDPNARSMRRLANAVRTTARSSSQEAQRALGELQNQVNGYVKPYTDLDDLRHRIVDFRRWDGDSSALRNAAKHADEAEMYLAEGKYTSAAKALAQVRPELAESHQRRSAEFEHRAKVKELEYQFDEVSSIAQRAAALRPPLAALLAAYRDAKVAAKYEPETPAADLAAAARQMEQAGNNLLNQLVPLLAAQDGERGNAVIVDELHRLNDKLYHVLEAQEHDLTARARGIEPENLEQLMLRHGIANDTQYGTDLRFPMARMNMSREILEPGGPRNSIVTRRHPAPCEAAYFRRLQAECASLKALDEHYRGMARVGLPDAERGQWEALSARLQRLPAWNIQLNSISRNEFVAAEETALRNQPDRYGSALQELEEVRQQADALLQVTAQRHEGLIDQFDLIQDPVRKREAAERFMREQVPIGSLSTMSVMSSGHQSKLLNALRAGKPHAELDETQQRTQSRLYKSMRLDPAFVARDRQVRDAAIAELMNDHKYELQRARAEWPNLRPAKKLEIINLVVAAHCKAGGFALPTKIAFQDNMPSETTAAVWQPGSRTLAVSTKPHVVADFEATMDMIFHENSHNWQFELRAAVRKQPSPMALHDPVRKQAELFNATVAYYDDDAGDSNAAYREQPVEAHAMSAGPAFARDLMRALDA
jgi:hypothetical protein